MLFSRGSERASVPGITFLLRIEFAFRLQIKQEMETLLLNKEKYESHSYCLSWKSIKSHHYAHFFQKSTVQYQHMLHPPNPSHILSFVSAFELAILNGFFFQVMHIVLHVISLQQTELLLSFLPPTHTSSDAPFPTYYHTVLKRYTRTRSILLEQQRIVTTGEQWVKVIAVS